ncbi:MAG: hypothetical protein AAF409_14850 [Pseudomonadota bacterium]
MCVSPKLPSGEDDLLRFEVPDGDRLTEIRGRVNIDDLRDTCDR